MGGFLGLNFDRNYNGEGLKVTYVLPHGPADKKETLIEAGDIILSIEGTPVSRTQNYFAPLEQRDGVPTS